MKKVEFRIHLTLTIQNLWLPDVEILDLKAFETHSVLSKLEGWKEFKKKNHNRVKHEDAAPILIFERGRKSCCNPVFKKCSILHFVRNLDRFKLGGHVCACHKVKYLLKYLKLLSMC